MSIASLLWLLPVVFMLHDFEEIIMLKPWVHKNAAYLRARFPGPAARVLPHFERLSTSAFALAVAEEFVLISVFTWAAVEYRLYTPWAGLLVAFLLHLIVHVLQFAWLRRYVPVLLTSLLASVYCIYALLVLARGDYFVARGVALWTAVFSVVVVLNVVFAHWLAARFEDWLSRYRST